MRWFNNIVQPSQNHISQITHWQWNERRTQFTQAIIDANILMIQSRIQVCCNDFDQNEWTLNEY